MTDKPEQPDPVCVAAANWLESANAQAKAQAARIAELEAELKAIRSNAARAALTPKVKT